MANSKITIDFTAIPEIGDLLSFKETFQNILLTETFKFNRSSSFQTKIPFGIDISPGPPGPPQYSYSQFISQNFKNAFNLDYNSTNLFTVTSINGPPNSGIGRVIIEANYENAFFELENAVPYTDVTIENQERLNLFTIDSIVFSAASVNPCQNVKATVTTSQLATKINKPINVPANTNNPIVLQVLRNSFFDFDVENSNTQIIQSSFVTPPLLNELLFQIDVNNSPFGATIIINNTVNDGFSVNEQLSFQYSLDNVEWQAESEFNGIEVGTYRLHIKDNLGCKITKTFIVDELGIQNSYFYISKSNSFRFANRITWGDSENYKNDENTLSCEVEVDLPYQEIQHFQSADIITTQFRSNYSSNIISAIKEDGTVAIIPIVKKTNNIGVKDKRDARKYELGNNKTGIYFISGNIYNYDTNAVLEPYLLNGLLPEWAQIGSYFSLGTSFYLIENILFDEVKNADVIVFSNSYSGPEVSVVAGSIYSRFNYEVYEFSIDMVNYINQKFRVKIVNTHPQFTTITHLSELIYCKVTHEFLLEIRYRNTTNTDIMYSTGIEFKIRIPYTKITGKSDEESEVHKTDTDAILLNADLYEVDEFEFEPMTKEMWRKVSIALSHEKVLINGVGYVKNGSLETEGPIEKSNLYVLTANMIKTGSVYNSQTSGNVDFDGTAVEVPGLISTESGYVRY